jgi:nucleotide-binding universal stress UspA family protein
VLCPIDFSDASRGALRYAAALAEHFYATLYVLTVDDPFLVQAATVSFGADRLKQLTVEALQSFIAGAFPDRRPDVPLLDTIIRVGEAAPQILRASASVHADIVVMSTKGASGIRKLLFGSTTERVLRDTQVPVAVTPASDAGPASGEDWLRRIRLILVPVDFSDFSLHQLHVGQGLAEGLGVSVVMAHVLEPLATRDYFPGMAGAIDEVRRGAARAKLDELLLTAGAPRTAAADVVSGDPADEIARFARASGAGAIVMALHASPETGRRIGSVTYRLLCQTPTIVLALPPTVAAQRLPAPRWSAAASAATS